MHVDVASSTIRHYRFNELPDLLGAADLMVFNNTRVIPARLYGHKETGGKVEILLERILGNDEAIAQVRASKSPKPGTKLVLEEGSEIVVLGRDGEFFRLGFPGSSPAEVTQRVGHMPLPPYIDRADEKIDEERYQTVYASKEGAVAAPTAGLHFDEALLATLEAKGLERSEVTLHVGAGTFQPVRAEKIEEHEMHKEYLEVDATVCAAVSACNERGGRVVAVGTTSVRSLETAATSGDIAPYAGDTDIFIYPGYEFRVVESLITNFHLPGSTLMMLVGAFAGVDLIKKAYQSAIDEKYRFFSYGDAMLITR